MLKFVKKKNFDSKLYSKISINIYKLNSQKLYSNVLYNWIIINYMKISKY